MGSHRERVEKYGKLLLLLQQKGLTLADAAQKTGLSQPTIRAYASGRAEPSHSASQPAWEAVLHLAGLTVEQFESGDFEVHPPVQECRNCEQLKVAMRKVAFDLLEVGTVTGWGSEASRQILVAAKELLAVADGRIVLDTGAHVAAADPGKRPSQK